MAEGRGGTATGWYPEVSQQQVGGSLGLGARKPSNEQKEPHFPCARADSVPYSTPGLVHLALGETGWELQVTSPQ